MDTNSDETVIFNSDAPSSSRAILPAISVGEVDGSAEGLRVLRSRLRIVSILLFSGFCAFLVLALFTSSPGKSEPMGLVKWLHLIVTAMTGFFGWRLCVNCPVTDKHLRVAELCIFGGSAIFFSSVTYGILEDSLSLGYIQPIVSPWILLIFTYALFVPNSWRRALAVIAPMAFIPVLLAIWFQLTHEGYAEAAANSPRLTNLALYTFVTMTFGATVAVWGVWTIRSLRQEAYQARRLGQYRLKQKIGAGGMGEVYIAEHLLLKRPCAIKLIRPEKAGEAAALARFEREVRSTAALTHWNTVDIYDYGRHEDGTFYYVMEYLTGMNLQGLVDQNGPLPPGRVVYLLSQTCNALAEAHDNGLIHRDIKPANIFAARKGHAHDVAKLLDFGLVRQASSSEDDIMLTQENSITGSPLFMSPEQATGEVADHRSDIYSLGCVGYMLLTGNPPFVSDRTIQVILAHTNKTPAAPNEVDATIPEDLSNIIMRCLEKEPDQRYQSVLELQAALEASSVAHDWNEELAAAWWSCHGCPHKKRLDDIIVAAR